MRLLRSQVAQGLDAIEGHRFELGRVKRLREGEEVLQISSGILTMRALEMAQDQTRERIGVAVPHCPTLKTPDEATVLQVVHARPKLAMVAEKPAGAVPCPRCTSATASARRHRESASQAGSVEHRGRARTPRVTLPGCFPPAPPHVPA